MHHVVVWDMLWYWWIPNSNLKGYHFPFLNSEPCTSVSIFNSIIVPPPTIRPISHNALWLNRWIKRRKSNQKFMLLIFKKEIIKIINGVCFFWIFLLTKNDSLILRCFLVKYFNFFYSIKKYIPFQISNHQAHMTNAYYEYIW